MGTIEEPLVETTVSNDQKPNSPASNSSEKGDMILANQERDSKPKSENHPRDVSAGNGAVAEMQSSPATQQRPSASLAVSLRCRSQTPVSSSGSQSSSSLGYDMFVDESAVAESISASMTSAGFNIEPPHMPMVLNGYEHLSTPEMLIDSPGTMTLSAPEFGGVCGSDILPLFVPHFDPSPDTTHPPISGGALQDKIVTAYPSHQSSSPYRSHRLRPLSSYATTDSEAVIIAQDAWSAYRCTPVMPSSACPKTARINLEKLEETLRDHEVWGDYTTALDESGGELGVHLQVLSFQEMPRDKLLAITQSFLHKALDIHSDDPGLPVNSRTPNESSDFVILPPARVLEFFLRSYVDSFERFYPLCPRGVLNPSELMMQGKDKASSLLLLLMFAQGALIAPSVDGRWLTGGLTETCRISLFNLIEKNIMMSGEPIVLHSALLFTVQAGWSGDKWQMDIAMGQRGMYFAMLRHSGYLEGPPTQMGTLTQRPNIEHLWQEWIEQENRSRLVYSWAMVDQDLSLFHDTPPLFSVTEFGAPMPDTETLWRAKSATEWSDIFERVHEFSGGYSSLGSGARPLCLRDLFRLFVNDSIMAQGVELTALHLRLLLHPLQSLVCQFRQLLNCLPDATLAGGIRSVSPASTRPRLDEVQGMLQRWYNLADRYLKSNLLCPLMQANLVIFHLVSLNVITDFTRVEQLAREEVFDGSYHTRNSMRKQCITDVEETVFHCGQVIRLIRIMRKGARPPWWAGAMYRVAMILWCVSFPANDGTTPSLRPFHPSGPAFAVDDLLPEHPLIARYLNQREGEPLLTRRDGSYMSIDNPFATLFHCIDVIAEGVSTRFSDGICNKLTKLARSN